MTIIFDGNSLEMKRQFVLFPEESLLEEAFWKFHNNNPSVFVMLRRFAFEWKSATSDKCGINMLMERVRWEGAINIKGESPKINNNHAPYYARLLEQDCRELRGMFRMRKQKVQATFGPSNETLEDNIHVIG